MAIELFPHNQQTYFRMTELFKSSNRVGVVQPTGTGKSFLYLKWIEDHPQDTFTILSPSLEIFAQLQEYANASGDASLLKDVQMISYQTLLNMTDEEIQAIQPNKIVLDEFHRTGAEQWGPALQKLLEANPNAQILGASATPVRYLDNSRDMASDLFDRNLAVEMTLGEAVQRKILPTPIYVPVWYDIDGTMDRYQKDIANVNDHKKRRELEDKLEQLRRNLESSYGAEDIFRKYMTSNHGKYIVFCRNNTHLEEMIKTLPAWMSGVNTNIRNYISISAREDKDDQLEAFKIDKAEDAIKLLFTIDRLNEGIHVKGIDGVIMLRPTISPVIYLQQMGRALSVNHTNPLIFDMVNNYQSVRIPTSDGYSVNVFEKEFKTSMKENGDVSTFRVFEDMVQFTELFSAIEDVIYPSNDKIWKEKLSLYKAYKAEFGCEPRQHENYQCVNLGLWVSNQRQKFKKGLLSELQIQLLLDCDFLVDPNEAVWQENFDLLKAYRTEFSKDPTRKTIYKGIPIGVWASTQRVNFKKGILSESHKQQLLMCGFQLAPHETFWHEMFTLYMLFREEYDRDPYHREIFHGKNLGNWVNTQRTNYKDGSLSVERISLLLENGFIFECTKDNKWEKTFDLYKKYKSEYNCVPQRNTTYHGVKLGIWTHEQRKAIKKGTLPQDKIQRLLECGLIDEPIDNQWQEMYDLYNAYIKDYGCEPTQREIYRGVNLGTWAGTQRANFKKGILSENKKHLLLALGFEFDPLKSLWQEMLKLYKLFRAEFDRDPYFKEKYCGKNLGRWVSTQKQTFKKGKLSEERVRLLKEAGLL